MQKFSPRRYSSALLHEIKRIAPLEPGESCRTHATDAEQSVPGRSLFGGGAEEAIPDVLQDAGVNQQDQHPAAS